MSPSARERNEKEKVKAADQNERAENEFLMPRRDTPSINQHADLKNRNEWTPRVSDVTKKNPRASIRARG